MKLGTKLKYLNKDIINLKNLATADLNQSMQERLDLVVKDGKLNDAAVCHASKLNPDYKSFLKCSDLLEVIFRDISKFDVQNSIISSLLTQIELSKITPKDIKSLRNNRSNNDDDDNVRPNLPSLPPPDAPGFLLQAPPRYFYNLTPLLPDLSSTSILVHHRLLFLMSVNHHLQTLYPNKFDNVLRELTQERPKEKMVISDNLH